MPSFRVNCETAGCDHVAVDSDAEVQVKDSSMPIAVVGIGCRFPGDASSPDKLWELVSEGRSALKAMPKDRLNIDAFYHPQAERHGSFNARAAHFIEGDIAAFDAPFFSITPSEAKAMDPQQRILLEVAYETLENGKSTNLVSRKPFRAIHANMEQLLIAGIRMEDIAGSQTSCYIGCFSKDYAEMITRDPENGTMYHATGNGAAILSNRLSWFFDLKGPSITLDTACSSSLVSLHLACQSLRAGESNMAIVGGTNLILNPDIMITMTALHFLSPDSKCHTFDDRANGYARGEGIAAVILKPLDAALRDNDVIRAVIRGTAVNQDGKTPGITLPSVQAQEELIKSAYSVAGLSMADTAYFEAHGTGTPAGDPIEAEALASTFGASRTAENPLLVGSVKTNIGHLEGASGLAGLIKSVYILEKGLIPGNLWFDTANQGIPMDEWKIKVPIMLTPWPTDGLRRVSVNSFGFGGTNGHVILDDAYHYLKSRGIKGDHNTRGSYDSSQASETDSAVGLSPFSPVLHALGGMQRVPTLLDQQDYFLKDIRKHPKLFVWSSQDQSGIGRQEKSYVGYLQGKMMNDPGENLIDRLSYTLSSRRSLLAWRTYCVASSIEEVCDNLEKSMPKPTRSSTTPAIGFVFTGQGAQWYGMGRELLSHQTFRESLQDATAYLQSLNCPWSLLEEFCRDEGSSNVNKATYSQPICTALQVGLVDLLNYWGVRPSAVVGHSSGEIAAAYCKGSITRESAWKIAYYRGQLSDNITFLAPSVKGRMMAVGVGEEVAYSYLSRVPNSGVVIACVNSPSNVTLSGDLIGLDRIKTILDAENIFTRKLKVETAYHSHHMAVISGDYLRAIEHIQPLSDSDSTHFNVRMFSSVTGQLVEGNDLGPQYWVDNMTSTVMFSQAVQSLVGFSTNKKRRTRVDKPFVNIMIELGPHAALEGPLKQIFVPKDNEKPSVHYLAMLRRSTDATKTALDTMGRLFASGYPIEILKVNNRQTDGMRIPAPLVDLPSYPWNKTYRYWFESQMSINYRFRKQPRHDLLGAPTPESKPSEPQWRNFLRLSEMPWIEEHRVQSSIIYPAAGLIVMALQAAQQISIPEREVEGYELRDMNIGKAMVVPADEDGVETMLQLRPWRIGSQASTAVWQEFVIFSRLPEQEWQENSFGLLLTHYKPEAPAAFKAGSEKLAEIDRHRQEKLELERCCPVVESARGFYESVETIGLRYGPTFQNLVRIQSGDHKGVCVVRIPDTKSTMPHKFEYPHLIHPATLDSVLQMALPALTGMRESLKVAMMPTAFKSIYLSASITNAPGDELHGYSFSHNPGYRESDADIVVYDSKWQDPQIIVREFRTTALTAMTEGLMSNESVQETRKLCSQLVWKEDVDLLKPGQAVAVFRKAASKIEHFEPTIIEELELASFIYIDRVLNSFTSGQVTVFAPHLKLYYEWMQHQRDLACQGLLEHQSPRIDWLSLDADYKSQVLERVENQSVDGKLLCRVGDHLVQIFKGEIEPLQVMLEDGLLYDFYRHGVGMAETYAQMVEYMDKVAHKRPSMKVLEIGAGTGGTTLPLLQGMGGHLGTSPRFGSYTFTDISAGFFEKAQEIFKEWAPYMTFKKLNIEEDPVAQGFELGTYDVIVAANVLHVSRSMDLTLANVKSLLKPGGKLVIEEITHMLMRCPMIVGCLPGWWLGEDDGRKWGPTMNEDEWNTVLLRQGFSGLDLCLRDMENFRDHSLSVLVSTAFPENPPAFSADILVIDIPDVAQDVQALSVTLVEVLRGSKSSASAIHLRDVTAVELEKKICVVLVEVDRPMLHQIEALDFGAVKHIILKSAGVLWVTRGGAMNSQTPEANIITGLSRTIRAENPGISLSTLDLDPMASITEGTARDISRLAAVIFNPQDATTQECEYALRSGDFFINRIVPQTDMNDLLADQNTSVTTKLLPLLQPKRPLKLEVGVPGLLDSLKFVDDLDAANPIGENDIEMKVEASGLNFVDIMIAIGQIQDTMLGAECSGTVSRVGKNVSTFKPGDRAMTWRLGCHQTYVRNPAVMFQLIPDEMTFEIAASIPTIYCTVYYSLFDAAHLKRGESILIHAASGGIGQAAIILAEHIGAKIFATVGSEEKKQLIMDTYGIPDDHIFYSRDLSFAEGIIRMTNGKGVDVVINSLAGEALRKSWYCLAFCGRFIELGKKDIVGNTGLDMEPFMRNVTFSSVNLLGIYRNNIPLAARIFGDVMRLVRQGVIKAVHPIKIFNYSQMENAFRYMQSGKHLGKIVLKPHNEDLVPIVPADTKSLHFDSAASYLLVGGLGGLGRSIARWMVDKGAKSLIFISRSGMKKKEAQALIEELRDKGTTTSIYACDISNESQLKAILKECAREVPPIRGCIQGAMVLKDSTFEKMTSEDMLAAVHPKVQGSWNLHTHLPRDLEFFVMLSSSAGIGGSRGQGNYAAGNTYQDALANHRASKGLAAASIDVGMILGVGFVAENLEAIDNLKNWGFIGIREEEFHAILASVITGYGKGENPLPNQIITGLGTGGMIKQSGVEEEPFWFTDAKFAHMRLVDTHNLIVDCKDTTGQLQNVLAEVTSLSSATEIICDALTAKLAKSMMMPVEDLDASKPANTYGVDSLVAVEMRNWIFREIKADVSVFDILSSTPLAILSEKVASKSKLVPVTAMELNAEQ